LRLLHDLPQQKSIGRIQDLRVVPNRDAANQGPSRAHGELLRRVLRLGFPPCRVQEEQVIILAIDPGSSHSAYVVLSGDNVIGHDKVANHELLEILECNRMGMQVFAAKPDHLVIELAESFGAKVWAQVFTTTLWAGRFVQAFGGDFTTLGRRAIKLHVTGSTRAKDVQVRQCLVDMWGGELKARGSKQKPGPLHKLTADRWAALAVAVTYRDTQTQSCSRSKPIASGEVSP
jgi:hypothetical protein